MVLVKARAHRSLLGIVTLSATLAFAARPASMLGSAKEDDVPAPVVAKTAPVNQGSDAAFMRALQWAFEPNPTEIRAQAIEDLGLLGDPRALNFLAQLALDPNPVLSKASVRAVALIKNPRSEEILCNIVRHPTLPEALKLQALQSLPMQNSDSALRFLQHVTASQYSATLQGAARSALYEVPRSRGGAQ
jgi:HEAT repeat protein